LTVGTCKEFHQGLIYSDSLLGFPAYLRGWIFDQGRTRLECWLGWMGIRGNEWWIK
jgi:hypothetical protein